MVLVVNLVDSVTEPQTLSVSQFVMGMIHLSFRDTPSHRKQL